jgi:hypothetical protein
MMRSGNAPRNSVFLKPLIARHLGRLLIIDALRETEFRDGVGLPKRFANFGNQEEKTLTPGCSIHSPPSTREDDILDLAGLADFLVVDHAVRHVFAHFRGAGDGQRAFVVVGEFAFADGDQFPLHLALLAGVDAHRIEAGLTAFDLHPAGLRGELDRRARSLGVVVLRRADPLEAGLDGRRAGGARSGALDRGADERQLLAQDEWEIRGHFLAG